MALQYLTVQDVLWINLQVTKKVHRFNYARLEEATFYQYAYGQSSSLLPQAARFLSGFLKMAPIDAGNEATIFVAALAFLKVNGQEIALSDHEAANWFSGVQNGGKASEAIAQIVREGHAHHDHEPTIRESIVEVLNAYPKTIEQLAGGLVTA